MKRPTIIIVCGIALLISGYFGLPSLFRHFPQSGAAKHLNISTAEATAVHIATSDPKTTLLVFEEDGALSVVVTKMAPNGDYVDARVWIRRDDDDFELQLSRRRDGGVTILNDSDIDGLPTKKAVRAEDGFRSYKRRSIEWIELPRSEKKPNQSPDPTPSGRGSS